MQEIPVYLFTGFMDSGKTTLVKDTLFNQGFVDEGKTLLICCEDGDVYGAREACTKLQRLYVERNRKLQASK